MSASQEPRHLWIEALEVRSLLSADLFGGFDARPEPPTRGTTDGPSSRGEHADVGRHRHDGAAHRGTNEQNGQRGPDGQHGKHHDPSRRGRHERPPTGPAAPPPLAPPAPLPPPTGDARTGGGPSNGSLVSGSQDPVSNPLTNSPVSSPTNSVRSSVPAASGGNAATTTGEPLGPSLNSNSTDETSGQLDSQNSSQGSQPTNEPTTNTDARPEASVAATSSRAAVDSLTDSLDSDSSNLESGKNESLNRNGDLIPLQATTSPTGFGLGRSGEEADLSDAWINQDEPWSLSNETIEKLRQDWNPSNTRPSHLARESDAIWLEGPGGMVGLSHSLQGSLEAGEPVAPVSGVALQTTMGLHRSMSFLTSKDFSTTEDEIRDAVLSALAGTDLNVEEVMEDSVIIRLPVIAYPGVALAVTSLALAHARLRIKDEEPSASDEVLRRWEEPSE